MENIPKREEEYEKSCVEEPSDASRKNEIPWNKAGLKKGAKPILQDLSSIETGLNCLSGITEIKKLKIEQKFLSYLKRFQSSGDSHEISFADRFRGEYEAVSMEYFCLLQGGKERFYIDLMEKLLRLRQQLIEQEDEYGDILKGKCSKDKEDVLRGLVITRRELEHAEKVYLISRMRYDHSQLEHVKVDDEISKCSDEDFLTNMISWKKEMMELEGESVGLLLAWATYNADILSRYSPNVLQRAVSWKSESLVMEELCSIELRFRQAVRRWTNYYLSGWQEMYPNLEEGIYIYIYKIRRLEEMVNLRQKYLRVENEYLWVLRERYSSFDVHQIHSEYLLENVLQISLRWRSDLIFLLLDTYTPKLQKSLGNDMEKLEKWKEAEREYCEFIERRQLTNLNSISLIDVTQVYAKYNHPEVLDDINSLRVKMKNLKTDCYWMLQTAFDPRGAYKRIASARIDLEVIEDIYFDCLKRNIAEKNFVQPTLSTKAYESLNIGEEEEFLQILYDSIKSYNLYCFKCQNCINKVIQSALKLEDVEELYVNVEDGPQKCNEVIYKFLNSRTIRCPTCMNCVRKVTIQNDRKRSSTPDIAGEAISHPPDLVIIISPHERSIRARWWEIRRLVVLGGLMESITSLAIVTAAMSANISDGNIVPLALTNLIAGLFIIRHDVSRLQKKSRIKKEFTRIEVDGNSFKEVLKEKMYCVLCFIIAYLSFLFFGLVPPLVYALSSLKIRNNNLKITAAAGASLSCTTFLAVLKAHIIQKPRNRLVYVKTAAIYVSVGVVAFGISYLAGYMFGQLAEKLPWDL